MNSVPSPGVLAASYPYFASLRAVLYGIVQQVIEDLFPRINLLTLTDCWRQVTITSMIAVNGKTQGFYSYPVVIARVNIRFISLGS